MRPKQFLALNGRNSLLEETYKRLASGRDFPEIHIVTNEAFKGEVRRLLKAKDTGIAERVFTEPLSRNTLPAIAWMTARISQKNPTALVSVFPADHSIMRLKEFRKAWKVAERAALSGKIVLMGIRPTYPSMGYGYIEAGKPVSGRNSEWLRAVSGFREKPDQRTAKSYLKARKYFWNAGIFVFKADVFLGLLKRYQPKVERLATRLAEAPGNSADAGLYGNMPNLSIDYGLMEKLDDALVVPVEMGWSDIGDWESLYRLKKKDGDENVINGNALSVNSHGNMVWCENGRVVTYGLKDHLVVQTEEATLVTPRSAIPRLKSLLENLEKADKPSTWSQSGEMRPWGSYSVVKEETGFKIKKVSVRPGQRLSLQKHNFRSEHWVVVSGTAEVEIDGKVQRLGVNESIFVPVGAKHRLSNLSQEEPLYVVEVQVGAYLGEDDITRYDDIYGRSK
jgi:mannose-1-phosphate guanylyltransferase/mannose-6-phosphate isomerase